MRIDNGSLCAGLKIDLSSLCASLGIILVVLKLAGIVTLDWWVIVAIIVGPMVLFLVVLFLFLMGLFTFLAIKKGMEKWG